MNLEETFQSMLVDTRPWVLEEKPLLCQYISVKTGSVCLNLNSKPVKSCLLAVFEVLFLPSWSRVPTKLCECLCRRMCCQVWEWRVQIFSKVSGPHLKGYKKQTPNMHRSMVASIAFFPHLSTSICNCSGYFWWPAYIWWASWALLWWTWCGGYFFCPSKSHASFVYFCWVPLQINQLCWTQGFRTEFPGRHFWSHFDGRRVAEAESIDDPWSFDGLAVLFWSRNKKQLTGTERAF